MTEPSAGDRIPEWDAECGRQLELLIGLRGLSAGEFARRVGKTEKASYKWRHAESEPLPATKARIVEVLGGVGDPIWDDERFRELAMCLGTRRRREGRVQDANHGEPNLGWRNGGDPEPLHHPDFDAPAKSRLRQLVLVGSLWVASLILAAILFHDSRKNDVGVPVPCGTRTAPAEVVANDQGPWRLVCASGAVVPLAAAPRNGFFSFQFRRDIAHARIIDPDSGHPFVMVLSLDTFHPQSSSGAVRVDCFAPGGEHRWTRFVDEAPAFADTTYAANSWSIEDALTFDWDADGRSDILLVCTHTLFPSVLVVLDADGNRLTQYWNAGHMRRMIPLPAETYRALVAAPSTPFTVPQAAGMGPALALSVEFQEAPRGAGMVILAPGFAAGAYPAATAAFRHTTSPPESDAVFVRFLPSIVARLHAPQQNWPENIDFDPASRTIRLMTIEEPDGDGVLRTLDLALRQVAVMPTDRFRHKFAGMQRAVGLPDMASEEMAASIETIAYRTDSSWRSVRFDGAWKP